MGKSGSQHQYPVVESVGCRKCAVTLLYNGPTDNEVVQCFVVSSVLLTGLKVHYLMTKCVKPLIMIPLQPKMSKQIDFLGKTFEMYVNKFAMICIKSVYFNLYLSIILF